MMTDRDIDKLASLIWLALKDSVLPEGVHLQEDACKSRLRTLLREGHSPQEAVDRFIEELKWEPFRYLDLASVQPPPPTASECKGSLGRDLFNVFPTTKDRPARLVDLPIGLSERWQELMLYRHEDSA